MSEETNPQSEQERRDFWKAFEPWYDRIAAVYRLMWIISTIGVVIVFLFRTVIVPRWEVFIPFLVGIGNYALLTGFTKLSKRTELFDKNMVFLFAFPFASASVAAGSAIKLIGLPNESNYWRLCFFIASLDTVAFIIGIVLYAVGQIHSHILHLYEMIQQMLAMIDRIRKHAMPTPSELTESNAVAGQITSEDNGR